MSRLPDPDLIAVARGDAPADLLLGNARIVNVFTGEVVRGAVAVSGDRIAGVGDYNLGNRTIDLGGAYLLPGFIDAHMHIESTMLPPSQFVTLALPHGTTGVVADPHEIANVLGIEGIRWMIDDGDGLPMNLMWGLSSCVPSCHLETSGASLAAEDLEPLFDDPRVVTLAEMMNFPGVFLADPMVLAKVRLGLERRLVDGHCPGLRGKLLQAYVSAGISSDHECTSLEEAREKLAMGMHIYIREGSAARNLDALLPLVTVDTRHMISFCTDDRHPADLQSEGHIDHIVRLAVEKGLDPITAIQIASINTARHYRLADLGAIAPGYFADLIVCDDLQDLRPRQVYFHGTLVADEGRYIGPTPATSSSPHSTVTLPEGLDAAAMRIEADGSPKIRIIGMDPHQLVTSEIVEIPKIADGAWVADPERDILKLVVIERHRGTGNIGRGFIRGFAFQGGALASTVGHDAHNLAVVGDDDDDMVIAARAVAAAGGGQAVVSRGQVRSVLPLPIAGLMSDHPAEVVIRQQAALLEASRTLGCPHHDPFMPLSFMPLPVIPKLKLSDRGLVDVEQFELVPLGVA